MRTRLEKDGIRNHDICSSIKNWCSLISKKRFKLWAYGGISTKWHPLLRKVPPVLIPRCNLKIRIFGTFINFNTCRNVRVCAFYGLRRGVDEPFILFLLGEAYFRWEAFWNLNPDRHSRKPKTCEGKEALWRSCHAWGRVEAIPRLCIRLTTK